MCPKENARQFKNRILPQVAGLARGLDFQGYGEDMRRGKLLTQRMGHPKLEWGQAEDWACQGHWTPKFWLSFHLRCQPQPFYLPPEFVLSYLNKGWQWPSPSQRSVCWECLRLLSRALQLGPSTHWSWKLRYSVCLAYAKTCSYAQHHINQVSWHTHVISVFQSSGRSA